MSSNESDTSHEEVPPIESVRMDERLGELSEISVRGLSARVAERRAASNERLENESERSVEGNVRVRSNESVGERSEMSSRIDLFEMKDYHEYATSIGVQAGSNLDDTEGKRYFEQRQQFHEIDQTVNLMDSTKHFEAVPGIQPTGSKDASVAPSMEKASDLRNKYRGPHSRRVVMSQQKQEGSFLNALSNLDLEEVFLGESRRGTFKRHSGDIKVKTTKVVEKSSAVGLLMRALFWIFVLALLMVALLGFILYGPDLIDALVQESSGQTQEAPPKKATSLRFESTESRFDDIFDFISQQGISSPHDLSDTSSIQYHAIRWLAETDQRSQDALNYHLVQRYVLAVVAYSAHESIAEAHSLGNVAELPAYENAAFGFDRWMTDASVCKWEGITCHEQGHLGTVDMSHGNLPGTIPNELFAVNVRHVDLSHNQLAGSFPNFLVGQAHDLRSLQLEHNSLEGSVPESVCSLGSLESLSVDCDAVACECCDNC